MKNIDLRAYGYVNGKPVYSRDEFVFAVRGFGAIESDEELMTFAEEVSYHWQSSGHTHSFTGFYLSDYALSEPYQSLTIKEFERLKELQREAKKAEDEEDKARDWQLKGTYHYADNSTEEIWIDKNGIKKTVMIVGPHGDVC